MGDFLSFVFWLFRSIIINFRVFIHKGNGQRDHLINTFIFYKKKRKCLKTLIIFSSILCHFFKVCLQANSHSNLFFLSNKIITLPQAQLWYSLSLLCIAGQGVTGVSFISFSTGSSQTRDQTCVSCVSWMQVDSLPTEPPGKLLETYIVIYILHIKLIYVYKIICVCTHTHIYIALNIAL